MVALVIIMKIILKLTKQNFMHPELQYLNLLDHILKNGYQKELFMTPEVKSDYDQKGQKYPTIQSVFGASMRFDLKQGFPLLTTKKVFWKGVIVELLWFLKGSSNGQFLVDNNVHIWDDWMWKKYVEIQKKEGKDSWLQLDEFIAKIKIDAEFAEKYSDTGAPYPTAWRHFKGHEDREVDQIKWVIAGLKKKPARKSYMVSGWHPAYIYEMARDGESVSLPACHTFFQLNVNDKNELSLALYQRSADMFLGVPFNIASYAALTMMIAQVTGLGLGEFIHFIGDAHIYSNHFDQCKEQITRAPKNFPTLKINPKIDDIDKFSIDDFELLDYNPHPQLKGEVFNCVGY